MSYSGFSGEKPSHLGGSSSGKYFGIYLGKIKNNVDDKGLGRLEVWIPQLSASSESDKNSWFTLRYSSPFAGSTNSMNESKAKDADDYDQSNQSYGIWMIPPDLNVNVLCAFINGDQEQGVWWSCLPADGHTHSLPAIASGSTHDGIATPVGERNRYNSVDAQSDHRPEHPLYNILKHQGLEKDLSRGHINAGPFRDKTSHPGLAYGIVSPGQHHFVLDDGPDGQSGQIRLKTRSGSSIIMDNTGEYIYIINGPGTGWIQLDKQGNIDFYGAGDFSVHAEGSINLRADNNINIEAGENINIGAKKNITTEACEVVHTTGTNGVNITSGLNMNLFADNQIKATGSTIDLNGPPATRATLPLTNSLVTNSAIGKSITSRIPEHEPYGGHNYRNGEQPTISPGNADVPPNIITPAPESYKDLPPDLQECLELKNARLSDDGFELLKNKHPYRGVAYSDGPGYKIGYGTHINTYGPLGNQSGVIDAKLVLALITGPSEKEASQILRQITDNIGKILTQKLQQNKNGLCITQSQFDSMVIAGYASMDNLATEIIPGIIDSAESSQDNRPTRKDVAKIYANSSSTDRNSDANYAMTGKPNPNTKMLNKNDMIIQGSRNSFKEIATNKTTHPAKSMGGVGSGIGGLATLAAGGLLGKKLGGGLGSKVGLVAGLVGAGAMSGLKLPGAMSNNNLSGIGSQLPNGLPKNLSSSATKVNKVPKGYGASANQLSGRPDSTGFSSTESTGNMPSDLSNMISTKRKSSIPESTNTDPYAARPKSWMEEEKEKQDKKASEDNEKLLASSAVYRKEMKAIRDDNEKLQKLNAEADAVQSQAAAATIEQKEQMRRSFYMNNGLSLIIDGLPALTLAQCQEKYGPPDNDDAYQTRERVKERAKNV